MEDGVEYVVSGWSQVVEKVESPEKCCAACQGVPQCQTWTWILDPHHNKMNSQCALKGGQPTARLPRPDVVSGVPPPRNNLPALPVSTGSPTLYCFSLCVPWSSEPALLAWQHTHRASIFACDEFGVYSNQALVVAPGVTAHLVDSDLKCELGGDTHTALNSWIFIAVWKAVIDNGRYKLYDWTIKVDPDAVFFPHRLRPVLQTHAGAPYVNNCRFGLHGPVEVLAKTTLDRMAVDYALSSDGKSPKRCVGEQSIGLWGEDLFLDQCLSKIYGLSARPTDSRLICEDHCVCPAWYWCRNGTDRVVFHPFKTADSYANCMANSLAPGAAPRAVLIPAPGAAPAPAHA